MCINVDSGQRLSFTDVVAFTFIISLETIIPSWEFLAQYLGNSKKKEWKHYVRVTTGI